MPPLLIINPLSDDIFMQRCHEALLDSVATPDQLQQFLRAMYPEVVVRPRELSDETISVWYVYRDGHWVSSG